MINQISNQKNGSEIRMMGIINLLGDELGCKIINVKKLLGKKLLKIKS